MRFAGNRIRDASQYASNPLHSLVAHHDQIGVALFRHANHRVSGSGRRRVDFGLDAVFPSNLTEVVQQGVRRMERRETKLRRQVFQAYRSRVVGRNDVQAPTGHPGHLRRSHDRLASGGRIVGSDDDGLDLPSTSDSDH